MPKKIKSKSKKPKASKKTKEKIGHHVTIVEEEFREDSGDAETDTRNTYKVLILKYLSEWIQITDVLAHLNIWQSTYSLWKQSDPVWWAAVVAEALKNKAAKSKRVNAVFLLEEIKAFLSADCDEKQACLSAWVSYNTWKHTKKKMRDLAAAWDSVAQWFLDSIEKEKNNMMNVAKEALKTWFSKSPKVALSYLQSVDGKKYKTRYEFTGAGGKPLAHAFPMTPEAYKTMLEKQLLPDTEEE